MRVALWRLAVLASSAVLWVCSVLQAGATALTRRAARWAWTAEVQWLLLRADSKCKAVHHD